MKKLTKKQFQEISDFIAEKSGAGLLEAFKIEFEPKKGLLFVTYDGVEIYTSNAVLFVVKDDLIINEGRLKDLLISLELKYFASKKAALTYIDLHEIAWSKNDFIELINESDNLYELKERVKGL